MSGPIARPIAQRASDRDPGAGAGSRQNSARKDLASASSLYITRDRLHRIATDLTDLDWTVLAWASASRLATGKQLVARFWTDDPERHPARARAGRRALKRLAGQRVLDALPDRARGGVRAGSASVIYRVGVAGVKLLALRGLSQKRLGAPGARLIAHTLACTQIAVDIHVAGVRGELDLIEIQQEPASHRAFLGAWGARLWVRPDLFVRVGVGALEDRIFIEADLGSEHPATLLAKAKRYRAHYRSGDEQRQFGVYPRVLFAVPDTRRAAEIERVLGRLPGETRRMFSVCLLDRVAEWLSAEARS
jgi:hypothetical protein